MTDNEKERNHQILSQFREERNNRETEMRFRKRNHMSIYPLNNEVGTTTQSSNKTN